MMSNLTASDGRESEYVPPVPDLVTELALLLRAVAEGAAKRHQPNVEDLIESDLDVRARFGAFSRSLKSTLNVEPALIEYARQEGEKRTRVISGDAENCRGWLIFRRIA